HSYRNGNSLATRFTCNTVAGSTTIVGHAAGGALPAFTSVTTDQSTSGRYAMNRISRWGTAGVLAGVLAVAGCSGGSDEYKTAEQLSKERPAVSDHDHDHDHHHHEAPHGGHLVMLGDHVAQVELVLNAETGE